MQDGDQNTKNICNNELIGKWLYRDPNTINEITDECLSYLINTYLYSFLDADTLHYGRDTLYKRISGDPYTLIGVWQYEDEQLTFFEDGTFLDSSTSGGEYTGTFIATDTHITTRGVRSRIETHGSNITFTNLQYNTVHYGTFEILSPDKWILRLDGEDEAIYSRV